MTWGIVKRRRRIADHLVSPVSQARPVVEEQGGGGPGQEIRCWIGGPGDGVGQARGQGGLEQEAGGEEAGEEELEEPQPLLEEGVWGRGGASVAGG